MRTLILTALLATTTALAATAQDASNTLDRGNWQDAASLGASLDSADGYTIAAKATTLGASISPDSAKAALLKKAQSYANQAIKLNPNSASAYFELARADGRLAQYTGILESLGLAGEIKKALVKAIDLDPKFDEAYVALGLWNAELTAKGGGASFITGARGDQVIPNFEKAIAIAPTTIAHRLEYANSLLLLNRNSNRSAAIAQLQKAVSLAPVTYWDKQDLAAAQKKLDALR